MGSYICTDCGETVEYSGGVPVRYLCSSCQQNYEWETLEWACVECGHIREINTYYKERDEAPSKMACRGCSTEDRKEFSEFVPSDDP